MEQRDIMSCTESEACFIKYVTLQSDCSCTPEDTAKGRLEYLHIAELKRPWVQKCMDIELKVAVGVGAYAKSHLLYGVLTEIW